VLCCRNLKREHNPPYKNDACGDIAMNLVKIILVTVIIIIVIIIIIIIFRHRVA
jgi:hypothetical protein